MWCSAVDRAWDRHTSNYICEGVSLEDGMRRMNNDLYDIMEEMRKSKFATSVSDQIVHLSITT